MVIKIIMTIIVVVAIKIHQPGIPNLTVSRVVIKLSKVKKKRAIERTKKQISLISEMSGIQRNVE